VTSMAPCTLMRGAHFPAPFLEDLDARVEYSFRAPCFR